MLTNTSRNTEVLCFKYPSIEPVPEGVHRPLWSVMIPTFNRTKYLEQTLRSVLEQAPGPEEMQIEVIDNCSTYDDPEALVSQLGQNRISFYRQPNNVGMVANLTTCIKRARGHLIHILHDDDAVLPGFYSCLQSAFEKEPSIGAAFCRCAFVDDENRQLRLSILERSTPGIVSNLLESIAVKQVIQCPTIVVRRSVYENLGGFHTEIGNQGLDWEMCKRIAAHYLVWFEPQMLAYYRLHSSSDTSDAIRSGKNIVDTRKSIEASRAYLPNSIAEQLLSKAKEYCALHAIGLARQALIKGDRETTIVQIREALKCSFSFRVFLELSLFPMRTMMAAVKQYVLKQGQWL